MRISKSTALLVCKDAEILTHMRPVCFLRTKYGLFVSGIHHIRHDVVTIPIDKF